MSDRTRAVSVKGDDNSIGRRRILKFSKWILYSVFIIMSYVMMVTPKLLEIKGIKPLTLLPLIVCLAMYEGEIRAGVVAVLTGLLWTSGSDVFWGFYSIILFIIAVACGVIVYYYFKKSLLIAMPLTLISTLFYFLTSFYVQYGVWGYAGRYALIKSYYLPTLLYTVLWTPIPYLVIKGIDYLFEFLITGRRKNSPIKIERVKKVKRVKRR